MTIKTLETIHRLLLDAMDVQDKELEAANEKLQAAKEKFNVFLLASPDDEEYDWDEDARLKGEIGAEAKAKKAVWDSRKSIADALCDFEVHDWR